MVEKSESAQSIGFGGETDDGTLQTLAFPVHNPLPYDQYLYDICAFAIKCKHQKMPVLKVKEGTALWLPYLRVSPGQKWNESAKGLADMFLDEQIDDPEIRLRAKRTGINWLVLAAISRLQLPQEEFVNRQVFYGFWIDWDQIVCCKHTKHFEWLSINDIIDGNVTNFLGSEVTQFANLLTKSKSELKKESLLFTEIRFDVNNYLPNNKHLDDRQNLIRDFLQKTSINEKVLEKLYSEFIQHCYPSFDMSYTSFRRYMKEIEFNKMDDNVIERTFIAMNHENTGFLSFNEFLIGLTALDPKSPNGQIRDEYIFRYYDTNSDGFIEKSDLIQMVSDLENLEKKSVNSEDVEQMVNKIMNNSNEKMNKTWFLAVIRTQTIINTSKLFRSSESIQELISGKNLYEPIGKESRSLSEIHTNTGYCPKCRPKSFTLTVHSVKVNRRGKISDPKNILYTDGKDIKFNVENQFIELERRYSVEITNNDKSVPNRVLDIIRELSQMLKSKESEQKKREFKTTTVKLLSLEIIKHICNEIIEIFKCESRILKVQSPVYVMGDIHGNIKDLTSFEDQVWRMAPQCSPSKLLFAGDYVDRGDYGIECVLYLYSMKILNPNQVFLLRGNHEIRTIQTMFTFQRECNEKYNRMGGEVFELINSTFDVLPIAAVIDEKIFVAHGGIPYSLNTIEELNTIPSPLSRPELESPAAWEILWSDPLNTEDYKNQLAFAHIEEDETGFISNTKRSTAYYFSQKAVDRFLETNHLSHIIRAHEVEQEGYRIHLNGKVITVFSCSGYCGQNNKAATVWVDGQQDEGLIRIIVLQTKSLK